MTTKIYKILGKRGRITIPFELRIKHNFAFNDVVSFEEQKDGSNKTVAYAYKLGKIKVYDIPKTLMDYGIKAAPQSFVYV